MIRYDIYIKLVKKEPFYRLRVPIVVPIPAEGFYFFTQINRNLFPGFLSSGIYLHASPMPSLNVG